MIQASELISCIIVYINSKGKQLAARPRHLPVFPEFYFKRYAHLAEANWRLGSAFDKPFGMCLGWRF